MERIMFSTYKVATRLPLKQIASFFNLKLEGWKEYIKLDKNDIEKVLKYSSEKTVYLFRYGCLTFVGFNQSEIHVFFDYLRNSFVELDNKLITHYNESHAIEILEDGYIKLWPESEEEFKYSEKISDVVAAVLAKSTELYKIETELNLVLNEADVFIGYLKKGRLRANTKKIASTIAKCTRFKYNTIDSVKLLDRPLEFNKTIKSRNIFDLFSDYFELTERYDNLSKRIHVLDSITEEYFDFRSTRSARRLLLLEILLLCIFPIMHFLE